MSLQLPGAGVGELEVNVIRDVLVPFAMSVPPISRYVPPLNLTVTPASTVRVTPELTVVAPVTMYGLFARLHVVFDEIVPETFVSAVAGSAHEITNASNERARNRIDKILVPLACCDVRLGDQAQCANCNRTISPNPRSVGWYRRARGEDDGAGARANGTQSPVDHELLAAVEFHRHAGVDRQCDVGIDYDLARHDVWASPERPCRTGRDRAGHIRVSNRGNGKDEKSNRNCRKKTHVFLFALSGRDQDDALASDGVHSHWTISADPIHCNHVATRRWQGHHDFCGTRRCMRRGNVLSIKKDHDCRGMGCEPILSDAG